METGAFFVVAGIATILVIHALQDPEHARRYARFLLTGQGPNGRRIAQLDTGGAMDLSNLDALPGFNQLSRQPQPRPRTRMIRV